MRSALAFFLMLSLASMSVHAQDEAASRRASLERQQQSDAFALELSQSQQRLGGSSPGLDALQLSHRQEQERLQQAQRRRVATQSDGQLARESAAQQMTFGRQTPAWGPALTTPASRWTPTLEAERWPWTPTLQ